MSILLPYQKRWLEDRSPRKIWLAARQTGKSFSLALEAVMEALEKRRSTSLVLSASERQSREVMEKVLTHLRYLHARSGEKVSSEDTREEVRLPNGSRIICLPANPDTVRGFSGNVFLDEFAFHKDAEEIWRAMYPAVTRGFKVRVSSTPNGKNRNLFHALWSREEKNGLFSRHSTTIYKAVDEGLPINVDELRAGIMDAASWAQEYECRFLDEETSFIPYELITACEDEGAAKDLKPLDTGLHRYDGQKDLSSHSGGSNPESSGFKGDFYLGLDIGRRHDLTVFWLWEKKGDVYWTRMVRELRNTPFSIQRDFLYALMEGSLGVKVRRAAIDATGIGAQMAEEAIDRFGPVVEPVQFTLNVKEDLAVSLRRLMEERRVRIPSRAGIREDFHSIRRVTTPAGNTRFSAEGSDDGHADRFWAAALGIHAGKKAPATVFEYEAAGRRTFFPSSFKGLFSD
ncbi:MAG: terminase family protein [Nitrospiraceae bacterium]|nr:terminase family protein [Nitrospiraceae bacterium]